MINLLHLNKLKTLIIFFTILIFHTVVAEDEPINIWEQDQNESLEKTQINNQEKKIIKSPILSESIKKITINIDEQKIDNSENSIIGIFDPKENDFNLNMWSSSDGNDIKNILKRISKLKLSKFSEDLLFKVLFTNAYPPQKNLNSKEFLKIKIDWLIKNKKIEDLETLLKTNPEVGQEPKAIKFLINEYLASADIKSACEGISLISKDIKSNYLDKFNIYCLINSNQKEEAQLVLDLLKEKGFKDKFFENKINFLLGFAETTSQKVLDNNLVNFYLSHITSNNFKYEPNEQTNKYIWRYLSSANLIKFDDIENEDIILTYELAAAEETLRKDEVFKIYLKMNFNFSQIKNVQEVYKNLPGYKARALLYQSALLNDDVERKLYLAFLLKELFIKAKLANVYTEELSNILTNINQNDIPESYKELVEKNIKIGSITEKKIKFDNEILHRSKVIKHFLDNNEKNSRTEKDFKTVYKKIKRNKKYFISIKDIIVLESLYSDGVSLPKDLDFNTLSSELTIPKNLDDLVTQNQTGLVMLKIIEIIGEDDIQNLDPETIYFINRILNKLEFKKIRNNILKAVLPVRV